MLTIDLMAVGQILGAVATFAAIITFLRTQRKTAQDEGKNMQQTKDMQDKIACHEDQIEALEASDTAKNVVIFLLDKEQGKSVFLAVAPLLIDAMKWISLAFLGLNVIDNGVQGKWYQEGLAKAGKE